MQEPGGPSEGGVGDFLEDAFDAASDFAEDVYDATRDKLNEAKEEVKKKVEKYEKLSEAYYDIDGAREYIKDNREDLEDIGLIEVLKDPDQVLEKLDRMDKQLERANNALKIVQSTDVRFSYDYMGPNIKELDESLASLSEWSDNLFHYIADKMGDPDSYAGRALRFAIGDEKADKIVEVSKKVQKIRDNIREMRKNTKKLVDLDIVGKKTNDPLINTALEASEAVDDAEEAISEFKETAEAIGRVIDLLI